MATAPNPPAKTASAAPNRKLGNLRVVWRFAKRYPLHIVVASLALLTTSGLTSLIPLIFRQLVDKGFAAHADTGGIAIYFEFMLGVVVLLAFATAIRFYFVSWLGERTVADMRVAVHRNLLRLPPKWFEENRPSEIASRLTSDTAVIEQVVGR